MPTVSCFSLALPAGVPTAIQLLPLGKVTATDGRTVNVVDPQAIVDASMPDGRALTVDENHATDYAAKAGFPAPAFGRITRLEVREDGIWGDVAWNKKGLAVLEEREYDGVSPTVQFAADGTVSRILRAALTNDPAILELNRLFHNQEKQMDAAAIRAALGLPDAADETAILEAARAAAQARAAATTHLATFAAAAGLSGAVTPEQIVEAIQKGSGDAQTLASRIVTLETTLRTERTARLHQEAIDVVDQAIKDGVPILTLRDRYIERFQSDPDGVRMELAGLPRLNSAGAVPPPPNPKDPVAGMSATDRRVSSLMGTDPAKLAAYRQKQVEGSAA
ncbi:MAG TPA: phage protease [Gammaproteobacteria bacterium]|nr:phage protease [Gammaproteobacteria bacterium]